MDLLSSDELKALVAEPKAQPCVSIYMPTERMSAETLQNPIRFKNAIRQAEAELVSYGLRPEDARRLLEPATQLDDYDFWQHQSDGLAIFIAPEMLRYYRLPLNFEEWVVVSDRFHFKPLLPLMTGDGCFYILALSQDEVRLLQGSRYSVMEVELEDIPHSLAEALRYDDTEKHLQRRTSTPRGGTANPKPQAGTFHGQGEGIDEANSDLLRFFQKLDAGLQDFLSGKKIPLILAGVEYLFPIYREANGYPHLMDAGITGNPEELKPEELHAKAWEIVAPHFQQAQQEAVELYREMIGTGKTSTNLEETVSAAYYGRVDQLFVALDAQQWGSFDPEANTVETHSEAEPGDQDLLDAAAIQTFLNGGVVYAVEPGQVPDEAPMAAVFRY